MHSFLQTADNDHEVMTMKQKRDDSAAHELRDRPVPPVKGAVTDVEDVRLADEGKVCRVIVPDDQLSLAIGKEGQNARLAARLTGYKIDIKPASQAEMLVPEEE